jgi:hypothetical protein
MMSNKSAKTRIILLSVFALSALAFVVTDLKNTHVSSHVTMDIHKDLLVVPSNVVEIKFAQQQAPMAMYETADQASKLTIRLMKQQDDTTTKLVFANPEAKKTQFKDLKLEFQFKKVGIASQFDEIQFLQDTILKINGIDFMVFEYLATTTGQDALGKPITSETYAYYQTAYVKNKTYIFSFYCPKEDQTQWQANAKAMMNSVNIRR